MPALLSALFVLAGPAAAMQPGGQDTRRNEPAGPDPLTVDDEAAQPANRQPQQFSFELNQAQFDQWIFGAPRHSESTRARLDNLLRLQVDELASVCKLSDFQKKKLILAGMGDIKRFLDKVDEKQKQVFEKKIDQNKLGELYQELAPLRSLFASGLFGEGSFYSKTLRTVLTSEDAEPYARVAYQRKLYRYRAKVEFFVAVMDEAAGFRSEQRKQLVERILEETEVPDRHGQNDYYLIVYLAAQIPEDRLKPLFDKRQWDIVNRTLDQGRGMGQFLRRQGLMPEHLLPRDGPARRAVVPNAPALPAEVFAPGQDGEP